MFAGLTGKVVHLTDTSLYLAADEASYLALLAQVEGGGFTLLESQPAMDGVRGA